MNSFSLTRADIRAATGFGTFRLSTLINKPYPLNRSHTAAGSKGGGRIERFLLSDIIPRLRASSRAVAYPKEEIEQHLIAADAAYRQGAI